MEPVEPVELELPPVVELPLLELAEPPVVPELLEALELLAVLEADEAADALELPLLLPLEKHPLAPRASSRVAMRDLIIWAPIII